MNSLLLRKILFATAITLLSMSVFYVFLLIPLIDGTISEKRNDYEEMLSRRQAIRDFQVKHTDIDAYYCEVENQYQLVNKMVPDNMQKDRFVVALYKLGETTGITINSIEPGKIKKSGEYYQLPIDIELFGDYYSLIEFLSKLYRGERFFQVQKISLIQMEELTVSTTIIIYSKAE